MINATVSFRLIIDSNKLLCYVSVINRGVFKMRFGFMVLVGLGFPPLGAFMLLCLAAYTILQHDHKAEGK